MRRWVAALDAMLAKHRFLAQMYRRSYQQDEADVFLEELEESIQRLAALLGNPARCRFVPVMLAEAASVNETARLVARLKEMPLAVADIVANRLYPAYGDCPVCREGRYRQEKELRRASEAFAGHALWGVPLQGAEVRGADRLARFWDEIVPLGAVGSMQYAVGSKQAAVGSRQAAVGSRQAAVGSRQYAVGSRQHDSLPTAYCLLPTVVHPARLCDPATRLLLFAGKGGVGKTTLACATALRLAQAYPDKEVLLFATDPAHSLSDCLGVPIGPHEVRLRPGLTAMEVNAEAEFEKLKQFYADEVKGFFSTVVDGAAVSLEFDREVAQRILDLSPPGLDEVMALLRAVALLEAKKYELFVLDTAPTGHLIRLLEMPELIQSWIKVMFGLLLKYKNVLRLPRLVEFLVNLSKQLKLLRSLLADPSTGQLYVVSILTEMALEETRDLVGACQRIDIRVPAIFLNLATPSPQPLSPAGERGRTQPLSLAAGERGRGEGGTCSLCAAVAEAEKRVRIRYEETFAEVPHTVVYRCDEPRGMDRLARLGQALYGEKQC